MKSAVPGLHSARGSLLTVETPERMEFHSPQIHYSAFPKAWNKLPKAKSLLLAEAESLNNRFVALGIVFFEVVEQATTLADQHKKTAA